MGQVIEGLKKKLFEMREQICNYEDEIRDIESYLLATSGPQEELIADLNKNQMAKISLESEFNDLYAHLRKLQEEEKKNK